MANTYALKGKTVLITGANGQLGTGLAGRFLREGAFVHVTDVQPKIAPALDAALSSIATTYAYHTLDVTKEDSVRAVMGKLDSLDILINNAGVAVFTPLEKRTAEELDMVMDVNIKGTILCSKAATALMEKKGGGKIINIGSIYGVVAADKTIYGDSGRNSSEIYGATKAGVIHLTKYLAAYLADRKITVNAVSPGGIFNEQADVFVENYTRKTPLGRMATTDDVASTALFLASDEAGYITGQNITVDGGFSLNQ